MPSTNDFLAEISRLAKDRDSTKGLTSMGKKGRVFDSMPPLSNSPEEEKPVANIVIVTALEVPERAAVLKLFSKQWQDQVLDGILYKVSSVSLSRLHLVVAVACQNEMGMVPATILAIKAIRSWQPQFLYIRA